MLSLLKAGQKPGSGGADESEAWEREKGVVRSQLLDDAIFNQNVTVILHLLGESVAWLS